MHSLTVCHSLCGFFATDSDFAISITHESHGNTYNTNVHIYTWMLTYMHTYLHTFYHLPKLVGISNNMQTHFHHFIPIPMHTHTHTGVWYFHSNISTIVTDLEFQTPNRTKAKYLTIVLFICSSILCSSTLLLLLQKGIAAIILYSDYVVVALS